MPPAAEDAPLSTALPPWVLPLAPVSAPSARRILPMSLRPSITYSALARCSLPMLSARSYLVCSAPAQIVASLPIVLPWMPRISVRSPVDVETSASLLELAASSYQPLWLKCALSRPVWAPCIHCTPKAVVSSVNFCASSIISPVTPHTSYPPTTSSARSFEPYLVTGHLPGRARPASAASHQFPLRWRRRRWSQPLTLARAARAASARAGRRPPPPAARRGCARGHRRGCRPWHAGARPGGRSDSPGRRAAGSACSSLPSFRRRRRAAANTAEPQAAAAAKAAARLNPRVRAGGARRNRRRRGRRRGIIRIVLAEHGEGRLDGGPQALQLRLDPLQRGAEGGQVQVHWSPPARITASHRQ